MKIDDLMSKDVISIHIDERIRKVQNLFNQHTFHHLLVVDDNNELVSVVSERDLLKAISPNIGLANENIKDLATLNKRVHQIMARELIYINQGATLNEAIKKFQENGVSCLPVTNKNKKPVGIITWRDILRWLYQKVK